MEAGGKISAPLNHPFGYFPRTTVCMVFRQGTRRHKYALCCLHSTSFAGSIHSLSLVPCALRCSHTPFPRSNTSLCVVPYAIHCFHTHIARSIRSLLVQRPPLMDFLRSIIMSSLSALGLLEDVKYSLQLWLRVQDCGIVSIGAILGLIVLYVSRPSHLQGLVDTQSLESS